jgi:hypothetical protein
LNFHINGEKFKIVVCDNKQFKLYAYSKTKWSSGLTFIGKFNKEEEAKIAATKYSI